MAENEWDSEVMQMAREHDIPQKLAYELISFWDMDRWMQFTEERSVLDHYNVRHVFEGDYTDEMLDLMHTLHKVEQAARVLKERLRYALVVGTGYVDQELEAYMRYGR